MNGRRKRVGVSAMGANNDHSEKDKEQEKERNQHPSTRVVL